MAQNATTCTPEGPTPPTNFGAGMYGILPPTPAGLTPQDKGAAGVLTAFAAPAQGGTPAEGAGTEVVVTATSPNPNPYGQLQTDSDLGSYTYKPNTDHASSLNGASAATITGLVPTSTPHGTGPIALEVDGTNFTPISKIHIGGVTQNATVFVSATKLTLAAAPVPLAAGTVPVEVVTGGVGSGPTNWTAT